MKRSAPPRAGDADATVFAAASRLLDYARPETSTAEAALIAEAVSGLPSGEPRRRLESFLAWWSELSPRAREESYVEAFDLNAKASLYLTARQRGDKRYRGQRLLALREEYRRHGLEATAAELPDYVPLVLEFAAAVPEGRRLLERERHALDELRRSLATIGSPFEDVVAAVLACVAFSDNGANAAGTQRRQPAEALRKGVLGPSGGPR